MAKSVNRTNVAKDTKRIWTLSLSERDNSSFQTQGHAIRNPILSTIVLLFLASANSCTSDQKGEVSVSKLSEEIIATERSALDRWITFDPQGYLDLYTADVTYFDPYQEGRVDGLEAMKTLYGSIKNFKGTITDPRYEMISPKVQAHGDVALLTFNLINYGRLADKPETVLARWNSTEVYKRIDGQWKIIHSHWSHIKPQVQQPSL